MEKYDKDVVARRFKARRLARKSAAGGDTKFLSFLLGLFALLALLLLVGVVMFLWG